MNTKSLLAEELRSKPYRDAFVAAQIRIGLPMQCRSLRESREWTQPQLAESSGMSQPRISELERPGERKPNLDTLLRLASAFDVALQVRFVPFSQLVDDDDSLDYDTFHVAHFEEDMARLERQEEQRKSVLSIKKPRSNIERELEGTREVRSSALASEGIEKQQLALEVLQRMGDASERKNFEDFSDIAS